MTEAEATEEESEREGKTPPPVHVFTDRNHVPEPWRIYRGTPLQLAQINAILARGHELGHWEEHPNGDAYYVPDEGRARQEFDAQNDIKDGVWVPKRDDA